MSSIVKVFTNPHAEMFKYCEFTPAEGTTFRPSTNLTSVEFKTTNILDKNHEFTDSLMRGQRVTVNIGDIWLNTYQGLFQPNYRLYNLCSYVGAPTVIATREATYLSIELVAKEAFSISELGYIARLYMID